MQEVFTQQHAGVQYIFSHTTLREEIISAAPMWNHMQYGTHSFRTIAWATNILQCRKPLVVLVFSWLDFSSKYYSKFNIQMEPVSITI
jgi:hypothetical protein